MNKQIMTAKMLNSALASNDIQHIKAVIMDSMELLGMSNQIEMPEPIKKQSPTRAQRMIAKEMHEQKLRNTMRPL